MTKHKLQKVSIGCRVLESELTQVDAIAAELGISRSDWLYGLIKQELGVISPNTVRSLSSRVTAVERKLQLLAK